MASTKTRISAFLPSLLIIEVRSEAEERHTTQSAILEEALEQWLEKKLAEDAKALSEMKFKDLPTEDGWVTVQSQSF